MIEGNEFGNDNVNSVDNSYESSSRLSSGLRKPKISKIKERLRRAR